VTFITSKSKVATKIDKQIQILKIYSDSFETQNISNLKMAIRKHAMLSVTLVTTAWRMLGLRMGQKASRYEA
jgi:hypothetical protein